MKDGFESMTTGQLVGEFLTLAMAQYRANLVDDIPKFNRLFRRMGLLEKELQQRPGDQRRELVRFYGHENAHVRLRAAIATLALEPEKARETLQIIHDRREFPDAADAYGMLRALDRGTYIPD